MKRFAFAVLCVLALLCGCNTPVEPKQDEEIDTLACEDVTGPSDIPWLDSQVQTGLVYTFPSFADTFPVEYVDKVFYTTLESEEESVAFLIQWQFPSGSADFIGASLYDCDGQCLASYGGYTGGCNGLCDINVTSRVRIYEIERSPQEKCERAIRGEWERINEEGRKEKFVFCTIRQIGSDGPLDYYLADLLISENHVVAGTTVTLRYSITSPDSLYIKLQLKGASEPRWAYTTHYSITDDTLLTIDKFSHDGKTFDEMVKLSLIGKY